MEYNDGVTVPRGSAPALPGFQRGTDELCDARPRARGVTAFYLYYCSLQEPPQRARSLLNEGAGWMRPEWGCNGEVTAGPTGKPLGTGSFLKTGDISTSASIITLRRK